MQANKKPLVTIVRGTYLRYLHLVTNFSLELNQAAAIRNVVVVASAPSSSS